jgi:hypothetical protein
MAAGSIMLAVLAFGSAVLGFLTTPIPGLGAIFSFAAPALALGGAILGGVAMSRAQREGRSADGARIGVILNVLAFVPALLTAMFCGVCNALCAAGDVHIQRHVSVGVDPGAQPSAGSGALPPPAAPPPPSVPADPTAPSSDKPLIGNPTPALPPPPLPAGPAQGK